MFVNIVKFPPIRAGKDEEFKEWFLDKMITQIVKNKVKTTAIVII